MPEVGEQSDVLRAIGEFLDMRSAKDVQIVNHEVFLTLSWTGSSGETQRKSYQHHELDQLLVEASSLRRRSLMGSQFGSYGELLRTLGQDLDREEIEANAIVEERYGFRVSGIARGKYCNHLVLIDHLWAESAERSAVRPAVPAPIREMVVADPFRDVIPGLPILTQDRQRIGKVADIRGRHFKVSAGMLRRDFWLSSECVANVHPGSGLALRVPRCDLDREKQYALPARG